MFDLDGWIHQLVMGYGVFDLSQFPLTELETQVYSSSLC